jgi:hypothetical protein
MSKAWQVYQMDDGREAVIYADSPCMGEPQNGVFVVAGYSDETRPRLGECLSETLPCHPLSELRVAQPKKGSLAANQRVEQVNLPGVSTPRWAVITDHSLCEYCGRTACTQCCWY